MGVLRVLVVEPDAAQRDHMVAVMSRAGFRPEGFASGEEALEAARSEPPQVAVLEVRLGDLSGYEVCRALKEEFGDALGVMFVSADRTERMDRVAGMLVGASEYMAKPFAGDELLARLRDVARRTGANGYLKAPALEAALTKRELEVLHLLADGHDQQAIAERLVVSPRTVGKHIEHILAKLPATSRAQAVAIAYQRRLHGPPGPPMAAG